MSVELLASDIVRRNLQQAAQDALADQLPRSAALPSRIDVAVRHQLASGLRVLATRLDPAIDCEPSLVVARLR